MIEINTAAAYHRPGCPVNPCNCWREAEVQRIRRLERALREIVMAGTELVAGDTVRMHELAAIAAAALHGE